MKVFIGLALLSVAFATPVIQPVTLPEAAVPAVELPQPELPEINAPASMFQIVDIRPVMVPQSVIDELRALGTPLDAPFNEVAPVPADTPVDAVRFSDVPIPSPEKAAIVNEDAPVNVDKVIVVDDAPLEALVEEEVVAPVDGEIVADAVRFVDAPLEEVVAPVDGEIVADAVRFVDAPLEALVEEEVVAPVDGEIVADAVRFVDAPLEALEEEVVAPTIGEIIADPVRFVDAPIAIEVPFHVEAVKVVEIPVVYMPRPGPYYTNPLLR